MKKLLNNIYTFILIVLTVILIHSCSTVQPVIGDVCYYSKEVCKYAEQICALQDSTKSVEMYEVVQQLKKIAEESKKVNQ
jgi:hypothetical protein